MHATPLLRTVVVASAALLLVTACGDSGTKKASSSDSTAKPPETKALDRLGDGEGSLNVLAWPGYAENGSTDKSADWVTPFEKQTGCKVTVKTFGTSDESVQLMKSGQYDVVSASGDASRRLIFGGVVARVNLDLISNYKDIVGDLKMQTYNSVDGVAYGVPHGRGANLLAWRSDVVKPAPDSWGVVFDRSSPYKGKVTAYDNPIYLADAALYLMKTKPDLGIKDPYALDKDQLQAAADLLSGQKANVGEYWTDALKEIDAFKSKNTVLGTTWQYQVNSLALAKAPVEAVKPTEGSTGWSDTWMIDADSPHPNCAYRWMDYIVSPKANAAVAEWFGEAPANAKACAQTVDKTHCKTYHATDTAYWKDVYYWNTPTADCADGRTDVKCTTYADWIAAWSGVRNS